MQKDLHLQNFPGLLAQSVSLEKAFPLEKKKPQQPQTIRLVHFEERKKEI